MASAGYSTREVARLADVHRDTLLRWLRAGLVNEPARDRHGWRVFTKQEAAAVVRFATGEKSGVTVRERVAPYVAPAPVTRLQKIEWDFSDAHTSYLTHSLHPYPAKFIPQIPNALIQELSSVGDTVLDPFCGSGTTLVESLVLKRHAIGIDANPLACLISRAKTSRLSAADLDALTTLCAASSQAATAERNGTLPLFLQAEPQTSAFVRHSFERIEFWFALTGPRFLVQVENHFMPPSALRLAPRGAAA